MSPSAEMVESGHDYKAACACFMGIIATAIVGAVVAMNWNAQHKLAGLEILVLGPFALLLYAVGLYFAVKAIASNSNRRLAVIGLIINGLPLIGFVARIVTLL